MKQALRHQRILILSLLCVSVLAPVFFLSPRLAKFSLSFEENKEFIEGIPSIKHSADAFRLNSIEQEEGEGLKEPARVILRNEDYTDSAVSKNSSFENLYIKGKEDGGEADGLSGLSGLRIGGDGLLQYHNASSMKQEESNQRNGGASEGSIRLQPVTSEMINQMKDQLIMAKAYLNFAPPNSNSHLVRELRLRIKEIERIVGQANKDSELSKGALQKMKSMELSLSKANKVYPDCSAMVTKLRAMTYNSEEQLRAQKNQASYLVQLAARTFPKGLHCLSMRLTTDYFTIEPEKRELPYQERVHQSDLYHYAIFSDNILACSVVVNSTVFTSMEQEKMVFHIVTDALNLPAMKMWFLMNPPGQAAIQIESMDDFKWLPSGFSSMLKQSEAGDPRYSSALNHLRFYLPVIFPYLNKVLFLDHDVVVQRDLRGLWSVDMKGKTIGVVETCTGELLHRLESYVDFSDPYVAKSFNPKACMWAFGMNIIDLQKWRRHGLTLVYQKWLQLGKRRHQRRSGSLPLGIMTFYNHTAALDNRWHALRLGYDPNLVPREIERAAVIHYDGNLKPWLEIAIPKYRGYWSKFLNYDLPSLQRCNIHE